MPSATKQPTQLPIRSDLVSAKPALLPAPLEPLPPQANSIIEPISTAAALMKPNFGFICVLSNVKFV